MNHPAAVFSDSVQLKTSRSGAADATASGGGVFTLTCRDASGNIKWVEQAHNLVVNEGLQHMNQQYFLGVGYTAVWYLGLYGSAISNIPAATDTMASHPGWSEVTVYSNLTRPSVDFDTPSLAGPSIISNVATPANYNINGTATIGGAFLVSESTKGGTTGILFSAAPLQAPGDRAVSNGDIISVTYTFSLAAA
jgi:hypothetical protein